MIERFRNDAAGKLVLRLSVGILMLFHGVAKLMHPDTLGFISGKLAEFSLPGVLAYGVFIGEILAPLMIILGVFTRIGGLLVAVNMLFAIMLVHSGDILALTDHGGWRLELQGLYLFGAIAILFLGSGRYAVRPD